MLIFCIWHAIFVAGTLDPVIPDAVPHRHQVPEVWG